MQSKKLEEWLKKIRYAHIKEMDLSLERTAEVAARLGVSNPSCPVVTIAGTNGKGSCVAAIEHIAIAAGYRTGAFTSPFIWKYNEQIRLQGKSIEDSLLCEAFACVEQARLTGSSIIQLTPFECGTLAALWIFEQAKLDLWILEVGMGGRFDAVNVIDADVAVVTSIDLDHTAWLGQTREAIAYEKAGIFRAGKPAVYGDWDPPHTLIDYANKLVTPIYFQGKDFYFVKKEQEDEWSWYMPGEKRIVNNLPLSSIALQNSSTALMAITCLQEKLTFSQDAIYTGSKKINLRARIELIQKNNKNYILDVAHNPAAIKKLAGYLREHPITGKTIAVFSMLGDKDIINSIKIIADQIDSWHVAELNTERAASKEKLLTIFNVLCIKNAYFYDNIDQARQAAEAIERSKEPNRIVIFGSFHTIGEGFCMLNSKLHG